MFLRYFRKKGRTHLGFQSVLRGMHQQTTSLLHTIPQYSIVPSRIAEYLGVPAEDELEDMKREAERLASGSTRPHDKDEANQG